MKRKLLSVLFLLVTIVCLSSCQTKNIILFLNWGEYIDEELLDEFEAEYNVRVIMDLADSNEIFYSKLASGTTVYDVICPSDYTVIRMKESGYLAKIDKTRLTNYNDDSLLTGVKGIRDTMELESPGISDYFIPYLWGTWGIMYSTLVEGLEEAVTNNAENQWGSLFNRDTLPKGTSVAMYESPQHAYYATCKYLGIDNTVELSNSDLKKVSNALKQMHYEGILTDQMKKEISAKNLDLGFMWTGDFLYYYCERIAELVSEAFSEDNTIDCNTMINELVRTNVYKTPKGEDYTIGFDLFIPDDTIAFCDNLVMPKKAAHKDNAYDFINFMCSKSSRYANTYYVDYNTPYEDTYDEVKALKDTEIVDGDYDLIYDLAIGLAYEKYYPLTVANERGYKGDILATFKRKYIDSISEAFNNARAK